MVHNPLSTTIVGCRREPMEADRLIHALAKSRTPNLLSVSVDGVDGARAAAVVCGAPHR